jgi:hypothetical protein
MVGRHDASLAGIQRAGLLVAGSVSVGVHAGLAPEHLHEWPPLGVAFIVAAAAVCVAVAAVAFCLDDRRPVQVVALLLAALIAAYAATRLVALPPLDPEREPLDAIGLVTVAVEAVGVLLALRLTRASFPALRPQGEIR